MQELFVVKHKSKYSCKSTTYFDLHPDMIKEYVDVGFSFSLLIF